MAKLVNADKCKDTATVTSTVVTLANSAPANFQTFAKVGDGNACFYGMTDGTNWEINGGAYTASGHTLARNSSPLDGSSGPGVQVTFSGTITVYGDIPAAVFNGANQSQGTNRYISNFSFGAGTRSTGALTTGTVFYHPVNITEAFSAFHIYHWLSAVFAGTSTMDVGLYASDPITGLPGVLLGSVTGINTGTSGTAGAEVDDGAISCGLQPAGRYWVAVLVHTNSPTFETWNSGATWGAVVAAGLPALTTSASTRQNYQQTASSLPSPATPLVDTTSSKIPMFGISVSM